MNEIEKFIDDNGFKLELFYPRFIGEWKNWDVYFIAYRDGRIIWGVPALVLVDKSHMRLATVEEVNKFEDYMVKKEVREKKRNRKRPHGIPDCAPLTNRTPEEIETAIREEEAKCRLMTEWPDID